MHITSHHITSNCLFLLSSLIQAVIDFGFYQVILSGVLALFSESIESEAGIFISGIIVLCYSFGGLYSSGRFRRNFSLEISGLLRAWAMIFFLSVLFAFTSEYALPLFPILASLIAFMAVNFGMRYCLRKYLASSPAYADTVEVENDTSLRKDYRHDMKAILRKKSRIYLFVKRAFDILSSGLALVILSPVFLLTAIAIKLEDGGPVFFSAMRYGKDMSMFPMHKFRSMIPNAESHIKELMKDNEMTGHTFKIKDDPRITRVGKFIRKYSIDELPQLWNIFTGDMSVVGPRPIITLNMDSCDDYDKQRWLIRPGLTCYWQVSGRADIKWAQWIEMDLDYIENMSITEDIKLILKTFPVIVKADGAY